MKRPLGKKCTGKIRRHFSVHEARLILKHFFEVKLVILYLWFLTQLALGRRVCEITAIKIEDFFDDFQYVNIRLAKTDQIKMLYVPDVLRKQIIIFVRLYRREINLCDGYLFFSLNPRAKEKRLSEQMAWQYLRAAVKAVGIIDVILPSQSGFKRPAYRIGTHSIRRLTTTQLLRQTDSVPFVAYFRGDSDYDMVMKYADEEMFEERGREELDQMMANIFQTNPQVDVSKIREIVRKELIACIKKIS